MIELRNATLGYEGHPVLRDVSVAFPAGQVTAVIGPNGAGKSTLLRTAMGLLEPLSGQVLWDGIPVSRIPVRQRAARAGILLQERSQPQLDVKRLVMHGRFSQVPWPRTYAARDEDLALQALDKAGIRELKDRPVASLSGGERQKAFLAMLLNQDPETMFFDEPSTFLDLASQDQLSRLMRSLASQGHAVAAIMHELDTALKVADRFVLADRGQIRFAGSRRQLLASGLLEEVFGIRVIEAEIEGEKEYILRSISQDTGTENG